MTVPQIHSFSYFTTVCFVFDIPFVCTMTDWLNGYFGRTEREGESLYGHLNYNWYNENTFSTCNFNKNHPNFSIKFRVIDIRLVEYLRLMALGVANNGQNPINLSKNIERILKRHCFVRHILWIEPTVGFTASGWQYLRRIWKVKRWNFNGCTINSAICCTTWVEIRLNAISVFVR